MQADQDKNTSEDPRLNARAAMLAASLLSNKGKKRVLKALGGETIEALAAAEAADPIGWRSKLLAAIEAEAGSTPSGMENTDEFLERAKSIDFSCRQYSPQSAALARQHLLRVRPVLTSDPKRFAVHFVRTALARGSGALAACIDFLRVYAAGHASGPLKTALEASGWMAAAESDESEHLKAQLELWEGDEPLPETDAFKEIVGRSDELPLEPDPSNKCWDFEIHVPLSSLEPYEVPLEDVLEAVKERPAEGESPETLRSALFDLLRDPKAPEMADDNALTAAKRVFQDEKNIIHRFLSGLPTAFDRKLTALFNADRYLKRCRTHSVGASIAAEQLAARCKTPAGLDLIDAFNDAVCASVAPNDLRHGRTFLIEAARLIDLRHPVGREVFLERAKPLIEGLKRTNTNVRAVIALTALSYGLDSLAAGRASAALLAVDVITRHIESSRRAALEEAREQTEALLGTDEEKGEAAASPSPMQVELRVDHDVKSDAESPAPTPKAAPAARSEAMEAAAAHDAMEAIETPAAPAKSAADNAAKTPVKLEIPAVEPDDEVLPDPDGYPCALNRLDTPPPAGERLLGYVRKPFGWINFHPVGFWSGTAPRAADRTMLENWRQRFPAHGALSLEAGSTTQRLIEGSFHFIDLVSPDLLPHGNSDYAFKLETDLLAAEHRFIDAAQFGGHPVVFPESAGPIDFSRSLYVRFSSSDAEPPVTSGQVLVSDGKRLLGPVSLKEDARRRLYVQFPMTNSEGRGVVAGFANPKGAAGLLAFREFTGTNADGPVYAEISFAWTRELEPRLYDVLPDETLFSEALEAARKLDGKTDALSRMLEGAAARGLLTEYPSLSAARCRRLERMLASSRRTELVFEHFGESLVHLLEERLKGDALETDDALADRLAERVLADPAKRSKLEALPRVADELSRLETRVSAAKYEATSLEAELRKSRNAKKRLDEENARLQRELAAATATLGSVKASGDLLDLRDKLTDEITKLRGASERYRTQIEGLDEYLRKAVGNARQYAFDGALASKFSEAAAAWSAREEARRFEAEAQRSAELPTLKLEGRELANYLCEFVGSRRAYDRNTILNLFLSTSQQFLTIFSGPPGSGKTSICRIIGEALGLVDAERYLPVSVERGWTSKRDFIGYWNPLTKSFESADRKRYEAFRLLDVETERGIALAPFLVLLDEANLSPMEYYWADFVNICDNPGSADAFLSLGDASRVKIPSTLRFVATVNNDFTTENISPRLLDRANVVTLPLLDLEALERQRRTDPVPSRGLVSQEALTALFGRGRNLPEGGVTLLKEVVEALSHLDLTASPRTWRALSDFVAAGAKVFETEGGRTPLTVAVDFAVAQKLLPKLAGNGDAYRAALEEFGAVLVEHGLERSAALVADIVARGDRALGYYRFF